MWGKSPDIIEDLPYQGDLVCTAVDGGRGCVRVQRQLEFPDVLFGEWEIKEALMKLAFHSLEAEKRQGLNLLWRDVQATCRNLSNRDFRAPCETVSARFEPEVSENDVPNMIRNPHGLAEDYVNFRMALTSEL